MSKQNKNDSLKKSLNKARMCNRRKNFTEEQIKQERERNQINMEEYRSQLSEG